MPNIKTGQGNHSFGKSSSFSKQNLEIKSRREKAIVLPSSNERGSARSKSFSSTYGGSIFGSKT